MGDKGVCLARDADKRPTPLSQLLISSYYPEYDSNVHTICMKNVDQSLPLLKRLSFHVRRTKNPVTVFTPDGGTIRYNNYKELAKDYDIFEGTFIKYFSSGNASHDTDLKNCVVAFEHPFRINSEYKIVSKILDVRWRNNMPKFSK